MPCWLHVGDLHVTGPRDRPLADLRRVVALANAQFADVDFVLLPGDNANEGTPAQYALLRAELDRLALPVHVLPGDHDFEPRSLAAFRDGLRLPSLPRAETVDGHRCLFLDVVSAGAGGPDFRLGARQLAWLEHELEGERGRPALVFLHCYPSELRDCGAAVAGLLARHGVACVAMGHTHYNELANDGTTIFSTVRSTGQAEEGPPGFALTAVEDGQVSWRFRELDHEGPFCLLTSPADERLVTGPPRRLHGRRLRVRARAWSAVPIAGVSVQLDDAAPRPMTRSVGGTWIGGMDVAEGRHRLRVQVRDAQGLTDADAVTVLAGEPAGRPASARTPGASDANALGAWPERGIPGGQLGPNRNGRQW